MKNPLIFCSLATILVACHTLKRSAAPGDGGSSARPSTSLTDRTAYRSPGNNSIHAPKVEGTDMSSASVSSETEKLGLLQLKYAILLNVPAEQLTDARQLGFIDDWYGTRYKYGGSDRGGVDCSGFVQAFMSSIYGIALPRTSVEQYHEVRHVKRGQLREGDLLFFHTIRRSVSHVGVYLRNNKFVHASTSNGVTISDLDEEYYSRRFVAGGRAK